MNEQAERHLAQAKGYIDQGDQFYRRAKAEIQAAVEAGATQREVARFLAKSHSWVQDVLRWDGEGTLYGRDTERRQLDMAKQVLREAPAEQVAKIVEALPAERRIEVAEAALKPEKRERERDYVDRRAVRQEQHEDPERVAAQLIKLYLANAEGALRDAITTAQGESWSPASSDWALARIAVTAELLDVLRMAVTNTDGVDWDRELSRLTDAADAAGMER